MLLQVQSAEATFQTLIWFIGVGGVGFIVSVGGLIYKILDNQKELAALRASYEKTKLKHKEMELRITSIETKEQINQVQIKGKLNFLRKSITETNTLLRQLLGKEKIN